MSAVQFDQYTKYSEARLREFGLPDEQVMFLTNIGLPTWCAPNMHFGEIGEAWAALPVVEIGQKQYLGLGEDRDDRAVALALGEYSVWVLDENGPPEFLSHDVMELSQALHRFQDCINAAVESDETAYTENRILPAFMDPFISWINAASPSAIQVGSFWQSVLLWLGVPNNSYMDSPTSARN